MGRIAEVLVGFVISLALLYPFLAHATKYIVEDKRSGEFVILDETKCSDKKIMDFIKPEYRDAFYNGEALIQHKRYPICWTVTPDGFVLYAFPDGDVGRIPLKAFHKMSQV